jgi:hypothetical protein
VSLLAFSAVPVLGNYNPSPLWYRLITSVIEAHVLQVPTNFEPVGGGMQWYVDEVSTNFRLRAIP